MTSETRRSEIDGMLAQGELDRVQPSAELAERFFAEADTHLTSASAIKTSDPTGSYQLAYDAARKACAALLAVQGLRATSAGGHIAVQDVVRAQFRGVFAQFPTLRRVRKQSEYPDVTTPTTTLDDASFAIDAAADMLNSGSPTRPVRAPRYGLTCRRSCACDHSSAHHRLPWHPDGLQPPDSRSGYLRGSAQP
jgi:hypothetical protein